MKLILSSIIFVILSATQQCNDKKAENPGTNSSEKTWTESEVKQQNVSDSQTAVISEPTTQEQQKQEQSDEQDQQKEEVKHRLTVSFYSVGAGIDNTSRENFEKFVEGYTPKVIASSKRWGREGEIDYCLMLNELSKDQQSAFVKKTKEILANATNVRVNEYSACRK